ncbi:hypothetical protein DWW10_00455 [Bacteroides intestinalis]|uniref:Uncharacterized protein n=1 Tax=Bacteroides intestinalis TaxID=329854 RepID=A0A412YL64_9BACE|nr:hypothetical protein DWW10_00455 [Bacteroides intestinalis]RHA63229.1 hypothetical protein DW932_00445 [Bacteroides intestinalis]
MFQAMKLFVSSNETTCFTPRNCLFHALKLFISGSETITFCFSSFHSPYLPLNTFCTPLM